MYLHKFITIKVYYPNIIYKSKDKIEESIKNVLYFLIIMRLYHEFFK